MYLALTLWFGYELWFWLIINKSFLIVLNSCHPIRFPIWYFVFFISNLRIHLIWFLTLYQSRFYSIERIYYDEIYHFERHNKCVYLNANEIGPKLIEASKRSRTINWSAKKKPKWKVSHFCRWCCWRFSKNRWMSINKIQLTFWLWDAAKQHQHELKQ